MQNAVDAQSHLWIELAGRGHVSKGLVFIAKHFIGLATPEERLDIVGRKLQRLVAGLAGFLPVFLYGIQSYKERIVER